MSPFFTVNRKELYFPRIKLSLDPHESVGNWEALLL